MSSRYHYLAGATVVRLGDDMSGPALLVAGMTLGGSATAGSALLAGLTVSGAVGGPVFGALLDGSARPGRLLALALAAYALGLGAILTLLQLGAPLAVTIGLAVVVGLLNPAVAGGWSAQVPRVFEGDQLARGNSLDGLTFTVASLIGPVLTGLIATLAGAPAAVVAASVLIGLGLPAAWRLPSARRRARRALISVLVQGFAAIARSRALLRATSTSVVSFAGVGMFVVCCPLIGLRHFGDPGHGVLLLAVSAVSALLANAALARWPTAIRPDTLICAAAVALGTGMALAAVVPIIAAVIVGLGEGPQLTGLLAVRHRDAPEELRTQIFTTGASLKLTAFATGGAIAGPLATASLTGCLLAAAGVQLLAVLIWCIPTVSNSSPATEHNQRRN